MPESPVTNLPRGGASIAALALLALAIAWPCAPALAAPAPSTAVDAAQAQGTPVLKPPVKRKAKPKALTCSVSKKIRGCVKKATTCTTRNRTKTCVMGTAHCRLSGRLKRCTITKVTCTSSPQRKNKCRRTSVKHTINRAFAVLASQAIPRLRSRSAPSPGSLAAAASALVSSRPGTPAAAPMIPVATSQRPSASGIGAGIGALLLAFVLMSVMLVRRRPRDGS